MFALNSLFLVLQHLVFGFNVCDLIFEGDGFMLFVFELIELFFEWGYDCLFLLIF